MGLALLRVAPFGLALFVQLTWFRSVTSYPEPMMVVRRDWTAFYETGQRLLSGKLDSIYPVRFDQGYLWLYPPYCIYLTAPLGLVPEPAAYALCFFVEAVAVVTALALMRATLRAPGPTHWIAAGVVLASMPFNTTLAMGQISGILMLVLAAVLQLWVRRRTLAAGLVAALLFIKPNIAAFVAMAALLAREWTMVAGTVIGFLALVSTSIPLGLARWKEYLFTTRRYVEVVRDATPAWKQLTLYAFWRTVPGLSSAVASGLWVATATGLVLFGGLAAYRAAARSPDFHARVLGMAVLLAIAVNLYAYFYDGLVLAVPGIVWYVSRDRYRPLCRIGIATCIAAFFVVGYVRVFFAPAGISWAGGLIALWAAFEAYDLMLVPKGVSEHVVFRQRATASAS